jgi:ubiquitin-like protein 4
MQKLTVDRSEFNRLEDANEAFENFLSSTKGSLSPHEIAKIRDQVGIIGMGGV